jgi:hypothetical protein
MESWEGTKSSPLRRLNLPDGRNANRGRCHEETSYHVTQEPSLHETVTLNGKNDVTPEDVASIYTPEDAASIYGPLRLYDCGNRPWGTEARCTMT